MSATDPLDRLAELAGILPDWVDVEGRRHVVERDVKRALLAAMGLPVGTDKEVAGTLAEQLARRRERPLHPIAVITEGQPARVGLPALGGNPEQVAWRLVEENGSVAEGRSQVEAGPTEDGDAAWFRLSGLPGPGYHELFVSFPGRREREARASIVIAPQRCLDPMQLTGGERAWGLSVQLYGLRSARNWGIGDLADLSRLAEDAASHGAGLVGLNPLHALFMAAPHHYGPYAPSSRLFFNPLYIGPQSVPEFAESAEAQEIVASREFRRGLEAARSGDLVDYESVARLKRPVLEALYATFRERHSATGAATARGRAFEAFRRARGRALREHAVFEALGEHFVANDPQGWSWRRWSEDYRRPEGKAVGAFAEANSERIGFYEYLQWLFEEQLGAAQECARSAGMPFGLYGDLAVAASPDGSMAWAHQDAILDGVGVGAPPDPGNPLGQDWGLIAFSPDALRRDGYAPFVAALRANMRHAGAIRLDHAMSLTRLFVVPQGADPRQGAYLAMPNRELMALTALESVRNACVVIGEDIGTLPPGFQDSMMQAGMLSYRVLYFEKNKAGFLRPEAYPEQALVTAATHDLPTLAGFWAERDLDWRERLGLYPDRRMPKRARAERRGDREQLLQVLAESGLVGSDVLGLEGSDPPPDLIVAIYRFLAESPSALLVVQAEDGIEEVEQANLPATVDEHPNWRRKLAVPIEALFADPRMLAVLKAVAAARPRPAGR